MEKVFRECFEELASEVSRKDAESRKEPLSDSAPLREMLRLFLLEQRSEFFAQLRVVLVTV